MSDRLTPMAAIKAIEERKLAAFNDPARMQEGRYATADEYKRLLVGLDLELGEIEETASEMATTAIAAVLDRRITVPMAFKMLVLDTWISAVYWERQRSGNE